MFSKQILLFLGVVLFLQGNDARYHDLNTAAMAIKERDQLVKYIRTEFSDMTDQILAKGVAVMEKVLKDPKLLSDESNLMKANLNEIRRFVDKYEEYKKGSEEVHHQTLKNRYFRLVSQYSDEKNDHNSEEKAVADSFKENGLGEVKEYIKERAKLFGEKFYAQVEEYYNGLDDMQKKDEAELKDLMDAYNKETCPLKRGDIIFRFMDNVDTTNYLY